MKVKADVHTVRPSGPDERENQSETSFPTIPITSWGTPEGTPQHAIEPKDNSGSEENPRQRRNEPCFQIISIEVKQVPYNPAMPPHYSTVTYLKNEPESSTEDNASEALSDEANENPIRSKFSYILDYPITIDPHGRLYLCWLFLLTACYSYNAWCIALRATFPYQTPDNVAVWMAADYVADFIYLMDVVLVKPKLMFLNEGFWVDNPRETRKHYHNKLQFKFDVLSLAPLDLLYYYFGPQKVILRFPRLLKLQTFWEFHQSMDRLLSSPYGVRIFKMLFYIFYLIHLNACAYYAMSDYIGLGSNSWVFDNKGNAYIRCFYFATKTATSIGKNPKPENTIEYLYMTGAWLLGVFVFAVLIGQMRDIIATATRAKTEYRNTVDACNYYLRKLNLPVSLQRRVTSWFNYTWNQQRCIDESQILNTLPYSMKCEVALEVNESTLSKVHLFRDCSSSLLNELVLQLKPVSSLPGEVIVRRGDIGHHMYIVMNGECLVMSDDEKEVLAVLKTGSVFGEISLLGLEGLRRRTATVRSRGYSTLFALSREDLEAALQHHEEAAKILRLRADKIIRENAERQELLKEEMKDKPTREDKITMFNLSKAKVRLPIIPPEDGTPMRIFYE